MRSKDDIYKNIADNSFFLDYNKEKNIIDSADQEIKLAYFISQVQTGSIVDLKNQPSWEKGAYIYEGELLRRDAFGNMLFGYVGKLFGYDDEFLCAGAGAYQIISFTSSWRYWDTYFDDPDDTEMIRRGIKIYNDTH